MPTPWPDDLTRLFDQLHAAHSRRDAEDIFAGTGWVFLKMDRKAREAAYAEIEDIIREKPE